MILVAEYPLILSILVGSHVDEVNLIPVEGAAEYMLYIIWFGWMFMI
jgi:hypothetical protein